MTKVWGQRCQGRQVCDDKTSETIADYEIVRPTNMKTKRPLTQAIFFRTYFLQHVALCPPPPDPLLLMNPLLCSLPNQNAYFWSILEMKEDIIENGDPVEEYILHKDKYPEPKFAFRVDNR